MKMPAFLHRYHSEEGGVAAVEFALLLVPLCILLMGSLELGYRVYAQAIVVGSLREAARMASTGGYTGSAIDAYVTSRLSNFRSNSTVVIDKRSYSDFTGVGQAEPVTSGVGGVGSYCFQDINNNGSWDQDQGASGLGGAEDAIYYQVNFSYDTLFPFMVNALGMTTRTTVSANTIVSNEPFAAVTPRTLATICT